MDADFGNDLCLGVWKKRQNCYDVEHYDLVFKKRGDEEHGLLFQPDECTWKDTLVCPDVINQAIQSYDDDVRRMLEIAEHTKREMIRQGFADESEDEEYEDVEEVAPPTAISLPPAKTPRKVRQKAVRASTRKTVADEDVPSSSMSRSPRESVSVGINALFNYGSKAVSKTATISKTSTKKLKKVQPSRTKKHKQATAAKKVAPQPENDVGDKVEVESTSDVAKLVDYHEKVISISTPAVVAAPQSSKPTGTRKTTAARRILVEEHEEDESDTPFSDENMETEDCGNDDQADSKEELLRNEMKRTVCMVDLSKDNLLLEGARNHKQPSTSREDYEDVDTVNEVNEKDSSEEEDDDEVDPSESRRSSRRSGRRLSGYAYSKKMTRERARSYRKSTVAKAMSQIPEDEEEVVETREVSETEVEEPGCSSAIAPSQVTASSQARDGQRKKPKRKPPVAGGTRKFNQKKSSTKSSFGSSTERFTTPTKQRTGVVPSTPSSSKKRGCMTPVSSKKHRGTVSYLNRSTGASRLRRAGDKTSATPVKTPVKYNPQAATVVKSFIHRNTPEKSLTKEAQLEAKRKLLEQKEREERERKLLIEEEKRMQIAETKRKREERARKANENRELNDLRRAEELKLKNEREQEKKARIEAKRKEDEEKKKLLEAKMTDKADKKRKHDNEKIDVKRQKMEEDAANEKQLEKAKKREEERLRKIQLKKEKAEKIRKEKELRAIARNKAKEEAEEKRRVEELRRKEEEEEREMELRREELRKKRDEDARKKRQEELQKKRAEELQKKREEELRKKREEELKKQREEEYKRNRDEEIRKRREGERKRLEEERKQLEREKERQRQEEECGDYNEFKTPTAVRKPDPVSTPLLDETYDVSEQDTSSVTQYNMTPAGPDKLRLPSTKEDYNIHDLDSGDSTDEEDAPRKKVPSWASGFEFKKAMRHQCVTNPTSISARFPDARIRSKDVDLNKVFRKNRPRYNKRTSSACWSPKGPGHVSFHIPSDD